MKRLGKITKDLSILEIVYKDGRVFSIVEKVYREGRLSESKKLINTDKVTRQ